MDSAGVLLLATLLLAAFAVAWYAWRMEARCWRLQLDNNEYRAEIARLQAHAADLEERNARLQVAMLPRPRGLTGPQTPIPFRRLRWDISCLDTSLVPAWSPPRDAAN